MIGATSGEVRNGVIEIRPLRRNPRQGWADDARRLAEQGDDAPVLARRGEYRRRRTRLVMQTGNIWLAQLRRCRFTPK